MTPEEIRNTWREAGNRLYTPSQDEFEMRYRRNKETALERLARMYKRFSRVGLMLMIMCGFYMLPNQIFQSHMRVWIALAFGLYFCMSSCMDYWLYKGICSIDCYTMTVSEVVEKAMYYRKKHHQFMAILLPCAIGLIGFLLYATGFERAFMYGVFAGVIVGGAIGYRKYLEFMEDYKKIKG